MRTWTLLPLLAFVAMAACDDAVSTPDGLTVDEVVRLSEGMIATTFDATTEVATEEGALLAEPAAAADVADADGFTATTEFTITRSCVLGGQVVIDGTREREWDRATRTGSMDLALTRTHDACTRPLDDDVTISLTGAPNVAVTAHHEWSMGERQGVQTLSMEGAIDWTTDDGRSGTCTIDVESTFDTDSWTRHTTGTFCNRQIDRTTTWQHGGMGGGTGG